MGFLLHIMIFNTRSPHTLTRTCLFRIASLPPTTHLQILLSLLESQPTLRSSILSLVPSLDVQFCVDDLQAKARAVVAAVPLGASMGVGMVRSGSGLFGAGRSTFDQGRNAGAMSEGYALNRLRAPTNEFCATVSGVEWFGSGLACWFRCKVNLTFDFIFFYNTTGHGIPPILFTVREQSTSCNIHSPIHIVSYSVDRNDPHPIPPIRYHPSSQCLFPNRLCSGILALLDSARLRHRQSTRRDVRSVSCRRMVQERRRVV